MSGLLSKVLAGGLSAGIFVLWWPAHAPAQGAEWLLLRGVLWTLAFEVLLLAFRPLEHAVAGAVHARDVRAVAPSRLARMLAFAAVAAAVPAAMLSGERAPIATPAPAAAGRSLRPEGGRQARDRPPRGRRPPRQPRRPRARPRRRDAGAGCGHRRR